MAATDLQNHKLPTRQASLQRMLDLEKKYKLARLHSGQTSPVSESVVSFQPPPRPPPIQARRRDSKESLAQKQSDPVLKSPRRAVPPPNLSINIPPPDTEKQREDAMPGSKNRKSDDYPEDEDLTPREKTVTFLSLEEEEDDDSEDDDDRKSEQSSICQSPSWEGYGEKKKKKKLEAEMKRREKELAEQEIKAAKKKLANRLYKSPPAPDSPGLAAERTSSSSLRRGESHQTVKPVRPAKPEKSRSTQSYIPEWAGLAIAAGGYVPGLGIQKAYPTTVSKATTTLPSSSSVPDKLDVIAKKSIEAPPASEVVSKTTKHKTDTQSTARNSDAKGVSSTEPRPVVQKSSSTLAVTDHHTRQPATKSPRSATIADAAANGVSYPPSVSRNRALRHTTANGHGRSNSASAATAAKMEEASKFFRAQKMKSSQGADMYGSANISEESFHNSSADERGRPRSSSHGYVRQARAQSAERSLAGYLDDVAVSGISRQSELSKPRPGTSHARMAPHSNSKQHGGHKLAEAQDPEATPTSPTKQTHEEATGDHNDYFSFVTRPYAAPAGDLTPAPTSILSSIRSRLSRRTSATSTTSITRSFADRANAAGAFPPPANSQSSKIQRDSHPPPSSAPASSRTSAVQSPAHPPKDFARLPKAARVLGEVNAVTMQTSAPQPGSRPSEGSSTSSYHDDSSGPPSPASTPDTSRPQSARGINAAIEEAQKITNDGFLPGEEQPILDQPSVQINGSGSASDSTRSSSSSSKTQLPLKDAKDETRPSSSGRLLDTDRPRSKGRPLEDLTRPTSRGRPLDDLHRASSQARLLQVDDKLGSRDHSLGTNKVSTKAQGVPDADDEWARSALPIDLDADTHSFVTSLTSLDALKSDSSLVLIPLNAGSSKLDRHSGEHSRPSSRQSRRSDDDGSTSAKDRERPRSRGSRKKDKDGGSHRKKMSIVSEMTEDPLAAEAEQKIQDLPATVDGDIATGNYLPAPKHEALPLPPRSKARTQTSSSAPAVIEPHRTYAKPPFLPSESSSSGRSSPSASHLHEARRSAPLVPSPLGSGSPRIRPESSAPPVTASRPGAKSLTSTPAVVASRPALLTGKNSSTPQFRIPAQEPEQGSKPVAKMLVECCSCKFFHDMPSRVYECMASPDAVVTDRALGVSGAITTMVKCPWCSHNMSTQCCAGYAAMVYLKERMH